MKSKKMLRILVPLLILAVIGGIYLVKQNQERAKAAAQLDLAGDAAFVLEETTFDLAAYQAHGLPLILDFGAEDCVPCQQMRPALEAAHEGSLGKAVIKFFDVWKRPELAAGYPLRVVPTQAFYLADGSPWMPGEELKDSGLNFSLYNHQDSGEHALTLHEGMLDEEDFRLILADMGMQHE